MGIAQKRHRQKRRVVEGAHKDQFRFFKGQLGAIDKALVWRHGLAGQHRLIGHDFGGAAGRHVPAGRGRVAGYCLVAESEFKRKSANKQQSNTKGYAQSQHPVEKKPPDLGKRR